MCLSQLKGDVGSEPYRLSETHDMFTSLTRILVKSANDLENRYWIPLMEQAVNVIYKLAEFPDKICGDLIKKLAMESGKMELAGNQAEKDGNQADKEGEVDNAEKEQDDGNPLDILGEFGH